MRTQKLTNNCIIQTINTDSLVKNDTRSFDELPVKGAGLDSDDVADGGPDSVLTATGTVPLVGREYIVPETSTVPPGVNVCVPILTPDPDAIEVRIPLLFGYTS